MAIFLAVVEFLKKVLDFVTPWSTYWVDRRRQKNQKKEDAQKRMDEASKKGDADAYWDARADKHNS